MDDIDDGWMLGDDESDNDGNAFETMCDVFKDASGFSWEDWSRMTDAERNKHLRNMKIDTILEDDNNHKNPGQPV